MAFSEKIKMKVLYDCYVTGQICIKGTLSKATPVTLKEGIRGVYKVPRAPGFYHGTLVCLRGFCAIPLEACLQASLDLFCLFSANRQYHGPLSQLFE